MKWRLSSGSIYLLSNVLNSSIPLLLLPLFTRLMTPEDYGVVAMFSLVLTFFIAFCGMGTNGAINVRFFQLDKDELSKYVFSCLVILILSSGLLLLSLSIFGDLLSEVTLLPTKWLYYIVVVAFFQFVITIRLSLWQAQQKALYYGCLQILTSLLNASLSLFFLYFVANSWESRAWGQSVTLFIMFVISLVLMVKGREISVWFRVDLIKDALKFGIPLMPHIVGGTVIAMADRAIIGNLVGEYGVGIYMVALQLSFSMGFFSDAFVKAYSPLLYRLLSQNDEQSKLKVVGMTYLSFVGFPILVIPLYFIIYVSYPFLVAPEYQSSLELVLWFLIGHAFTGMYYAVSNFYFFASRTGRLAFITTTIGVATVIASIYLIKAFGLLGGAIGFLLGQLIQFLFVFILGAKIIDLPWLSFRRAFNTLSTGKEQSAV